CRPVEIAGRIINEIANGTVAVASLLKTVNCSLVPFSNRPQKQLINSTDTVRTAVVSGPIEFTRRSAEQCAVRKTPIRLTMKRIKRPEIPFSNCCRSELENNSAAIKAARSRSAIEPPMIQQHSSSRTAGSVCAAGESVNHLKIPTPSVWMDSVNRAYAVCAANRRHAIDIPAPIKCDSGAWTRTIVATSERIDDCLRPRASRVGQL